MQKITTCLWFDNQSEEAVKFYTSVFKNSKTGVTTRYSEEASKAAKMPVGSVMSQTFTIEDMDFLTINGGPVFKKNPSVSFHFKCKTKDEVDDSWKKLSEGGKVLMELGSYPWSERYGWLEDKFGVSWQLISAGGDEIKQKITPVLLFVGKVCGKAEEAAKFYAPVFHGKVDMVVPYGKGEEPDKEGTVKYESFTLDGKEFGAMDSAREHNFAFNEAISFMVNCNTQEEIDYYWGKLTSGGGQESFCGWLKDKYGLSWQIVPAELEKLMSEPGKYKRVMAALLQMKKLDLNVLRNA